MLKHLLCLTAIVALAACEAPQQLSDYRPVVDPAKSSPAKFENDLTACRNIAIQVEADYKERQQKEMVSGLIAGALIGAATGAIAGGGSSHKSDYILAGTAVGAAGGAASGDHTYDLVKYGPRRIVDRCMAERGHAILNDIGRG